LPRLWWLYRQAVTETRTVSVPVRVPSHPGLVKHGRMTDRVSTRQLPSAESGQVSSYVAARVKRSVKPSATPSQVRILDLPPPAETCHGLRILRSFRPSAPVPSCPTRSSGVPLFAAVHGHIADRIRDHEAHSAARPWATVLGRARPSMPSRPRLHSGDASARRPCRLPRRGRAMEVWSALRVSIMGSGRYGIWTRAAVAGKSVMFALSVPAAGCSN